MKRTSDNGRSPTHYKISMMQLIPFRFPSFWVGCSKKRVGCFPPFLQPHRPPGRTALPSRCPLVPATADVSCDLSRSILIAHTGLDSLQVQAAHQKVLFLIVT